MTHKLYEYEYENFKNVYEYRVLLPHVWSIQLSLLTAGVGFGLWYILEQLYHILLMAHRKQLCLL